MRAARSRYGSAREKTFGVNFRAMRTPGAASTTIVAGRFEMPVVVAIHRLKNFEEWFKLFKSNPHQRLAIGGFYAEWKIQTEFTLWRS